MLEQALRASCNSSREKETHDRVARGGLLSLFATVIIQAEVGFSGKNITILAVATVIIDL